MEAPDTPGNKQIHDAGKKTMSIVLAGYKQHLTNIDMEVDQFTEQNIVGMLIADLRLAFGDEVVIESESWMP